MRARQLALSGITVRPIAALARAYGGRDDSCPQIDFSDDVILAIGNVHCLAVSRNAQTLRSRQSSRTQRAEPGGDGGAAITGVTTIAISGYSFHCLLRAVEQKYAVALPKRQIPLAVACDFQRSRSGQRRFRRMS